MKRTVYCNELNETKVGERHTINGWVHRRRDHGGLLFMEVRDTSGLVQVVFSPDIDCTSHALAEALRSEFVVAVTGTVHRRQEGQENPDLPTGAVELYGEQLVVLNEARTPPIYVNDDDKSDEALRLQYRYLELRRPRSGQRLKLRHRVVKAMRDFFDNEAFVEIETPHLTRSTPEGARDYLVPARMGRGKFYALPQSPQLFKQLLVIAGVDKYMQIARCFRDEDLRADRQPEFTQLDVEMAFVDEEAVMQMTESMFRYLFALVMDHELTTPFRRMSHEHALSVYGTDKPDLRFALPIVDVSELFVGTDFGIFARVLAQGGVIRALCLPGQAILSRRQVKELEERTQKAGAGGAVPVAYLAQGVRSTVSRFVSEQVWEKLAEKTAASAGDLVLLVADEGDVASKALGQIRVHMAQRLGLIDEGTWAFVWVTDFPLLEYDEQEERYVAAHHPFTSPREQDWCRLDSEPGTVRARAYDLVLNGVELASGSVRIHQRERQEHLLSALGMSREEAVERFGFFLEALEYGAPPHAGIALGLDRLVMMMAGAESIREVIAFPKTTQGNCLLTEAPTAIGREQLSQLGLSLETQGRKDEARAGLRPDPKRQ